MFSMRQITLLVLAVGLISAAIADETEHKSTDRYVTRFEKRAQLAYTPRIEMVRKRFAQRSWIPFRSLPTGVTYKLVPVVSWVPKWTEEMTPVTERLAANNSHRTDLQSEERSSGWKPIDRRPTPNPAIRPIVDSSDVIGGVQRFESDFPRIGSRFQELR